MTPKEKAKELFDKYADEFNFDDTYRGYREQSKQCALIAVDEIMHYIRWHLSYGYEKQLEYYKEVKQEINNI